jgi:hypothetical protein
MWEVRMNYMRIRCLNDGCSASEKEAVTIPAGRPVAPGVTEKLGTLVCDECGHHMWTELVK